MSLFPLKPTYAAAKACCAAIAQFHRPGDKAKDLPLENVSPGELLQYDKAVAMETLTRRRYTLESAPGPVWTDV